MSANTPFQLNGHSYADAKIIFDGIELPGVTAFDYDVKKTKTNNYGLGENPVSRSRGTNEFSGTMEMDFDTIKLLRKLSPTGLITAIPVGLLILTLENSDGSFEVVTVGFFEFGGDGVGGTQGDENFKKSVDIIFGSITFNTI